ncbi:MAG: ferrochelatase [Pseudomonadales bacterium]|nr:ferrochelatase [Pseudomonadales bacterium]
MKYLGQTDYPNDQQPTGTGILLVNLGTPDAPTRKATHRYLKTFLSDPRVVEAPRLLWWFILRIAILSWRPASSAKLYAKIWTDQGSPLLIISQQQTEALQKAINQKLPQSKIPVVLGMRYGNPSIEAGIEALTKQNVREIIVLPLYPQYSGSTGGSTFDEVTRVLKRYRWVPSLNFIHGYHLSEPYLDAIADSIEQHIQQQTQQQGMPERILFSFHGTPEKQRDSGDPYHYNCLETTRLVQQKLVERNVLKEDQILTTFQSRVGRDPWLQPYTDKTLEKLASEGIKNVAVVCPGFSADCLETLEEIEILNREVFIAAGGEQYSYIPALNDSPEHIDALYNIVEPLINKAKIV